MIFNFIYLFININKKIKVFIQDEFFLFYYIKNYKLPE